jgi:hypothetical protein
VRHGFPYQPFYCEENVWRLCADPRVGDGERLVAWITGPAGPDGRAGNCALWHQRAAAPGEPILWDYHTILLVRDAAWRVWDLDTDLGLPLAAEDYLAATFADQRLVPPRWRARFRVMYAGDYARTLASDRSHMRRPDGSWLRPPPEWAPPGDGGSNVARFLDLTTPFIGEVVDLAGLRARLGTG